MSRFGCRRRRGRASRSRRPAGSPPARRRTRREPGSRSASADRRRSAGSHASRPRGRRRRSGSTRFAAVRRLDEQVLVVKDLARLPECLVLLVLEGDVDGSVGADRRVRAWSSSQRPAVPLTWNVQSAAFEPEISWGFVQCFRRRRSATRRSAKTGTSRSSRRTSSTSGTSVRSGATSECYR